MAAASFNRRGIAHKITWPINAPNMISIQPILYAWFQCLKSPLGHLLNKFYRKRTVCVQSAGPGDFDPKHSLLIMRIRDCRPILKGQSFRPENSSPQLHISFACIILQHSTCREQCDDRAKKKCIHFLQNQLCVFTHYWLGAYCRGVSRLRAQNTRRGLARCNRGARTND